MSNKSEKWLVKNLKKDFIIEILHEHLPNDMNFDNMTKQELVKEYYSIIAGHYNTYGFKTTKQFEKDLLKNCRKDF